MTHQPSPRELKEMLRRAAARPPLGDAGRTGAVPFAFLAYARQDARLAAALVEALEARGIAVEWDGRLKGGENFRRRIGELIEAAAAVVVLWSPASVGSDFVIDEAEAGKALGKLVTCRTAGLDERELPFGFRQLHCADAADTDAIVRALASLGLASG